MHTKNIIKVLLVSFILVSCTPVSLASSTEPASPIGIITPTFTPLPIQPTISPTETPAPRIWRWSNVTTTYNDLAIISSSEMWVIGQNGIIIHDKPHVMHLTNPYPYAGEYDFAGGGYLSAVDFVSDNNGWLTAYGGQIFHWDGLSWNISFPFGFENPTWKDITFANPDTGWVVGCNRNDNNDNIPVIMQWNGSSWNNVTLPSQITDKYCFTEISVVSETDVWAVADKWEKALLLHWDGQQWENIQLPPNFKSAYNANSISALDSSHVWVLGNNTISHWNGSTWKTDELPVHSFSTENYYATPSILALAPDNVWVGGRSLFWWNGRDWINGNYETDFDFIVDIEKDSDNNVWALTLMGRILQLSEEGKWLL